MTQEQFCAIGVAMVVIFIGSNVMAYMIHYRTTQKLDDIRAELRKLNSKPK